MVRTGDTTPLVSVQSRADALSQVVFRLSSNLPVTVAAAGIQCSICYLLPLPLSSPQRGSRALVIIHTVREWSPCPGSPSASLLP